MGLLDSFLQGASNSAASTLSVPVDVLAWALRKAGLPIPSNPVGGSDWLAQQGLTREPENRNMGLLGEAIGGVAPMVAAAKAPQIAKGLLQMEANAMAPRTMNPQTGAIVWHGSPHKFDKFDASKIGTGEGAQAYGHGLYLAESPDVAKEYQRALGRPDSAGLTKAQDVAAWAHSTGASGADEAVRVLEDEIARLEKYGKFDGKKLSRNTYMEALAMVKQNAAPTNGSLYKVDLPDEHIAKMLDWDKPLSQQQNVVKQLQSLSNEAGDLYPSLRDALQPFELSSNTGASVYSALARDAGLDKNASKDLLNAGIPGIRYLDGGSRGTGAGTSNFVIFPGNEGLLSILERNGQALR